MNARMLPVAAAVVLLGHCVLADAPAHHAVIIGINDYADPGIPKLKFAESDARAVFDTLTNPAIGQFPRDNVKLLLGKEATNDTIKSALYKLRGVGKDDLVVVFFSGHGAKEGNEAFWVTQAAEAKALPATALSNSDIRKRLDKIPSQRLVVLLDCCYAASTVKKDLADPGKLFGEFAGKGRVTIAGAADHQEALELPDKKAGVFTYFLAQGLAGAADANADGVVTFEELWSYLSGNVRAASVKQGGLHEPVLISEGGVTPQFLLTYNPKVAAASSEAVKTLRRMFDDGKITGAQLDQGRKALSEPALDSVAKATREVFSDLAAGRLDPKYLEVALGRIPRPAEVVEPPTTQPGKPTLAVVPFMELGHAKGKDYGFMLAEKLLPFFADKYELINQTQLAAFCKQDDLTAADLAEALSAPPATKALTKAVKLKAVRYLVVGSVSGYPDGTLGMTASLCDWQTGRVESNRIGQIGGENWGDLVRRLPLLAGKLTGGIGEAGPVTTWPGVNDLERGKFEELKATVESHRQLLRDELAKPLAERDYAGMLAKFQALRAKAQQDNSDSLKKYADAVIEYLKRQMEIQQGRGE